MRAVEREAVGEGIARGREEFMEEVEHMKARLGVDQSGEVLVEERDDVARLLLSERRRCVSSAAAAGA